MANHGITHNSDPVLPDQGGRTIAIDPLGTNASQEDLVRRRAYEIYEQRGKEQGNDMQHWLDAERETTATRH